MRLSFNSISFESCIALRERRDMVGGPSYNIIEVVTLKNEGGGLQAEVGPSQLSGRGFNSSCF